MAKVGSFLEKEERPNLSNIGSTAGSSLMASHEAENPNTDLGRSLIASSIGSAAGHHSLTAPGKVAKKYKSWKHTPEPEALDELPLKATKDYKEKTSQAYKDLVNPIEQSLDATKAKVSLQGVISHLTEEMNKLESSHARRHFLKKTEEGKILEDLWKYPDEVSFQEAKKIQEMIRKRADAVGAFEVNKTATGKDLAQIDTKFKEALEQAVQKSLPNKLEDYLKAKALWSHKASKIDPLIEDYSSE